MKHFSLYTIILLAFLFPDTTAAQQKISFFSDTIRKEPISRATQILSDNKQYIYFAGPSFHVNGGQPTTAITKMDMDGRHIWTHTLNKETDEEFNNPIYSTTHINVMQNYEFNAMYLDSNYVLAVFTQVAQPSFIYALDIKTGKTLWKRKTYFVYPYPLSQGSNEYFSYFTNDLDDLNYRLLDKHSGKIISSKKMRYPPDSLPNIVRHAADGSTYFIRNERIFRYTTPSLDSLAWAKTIVTDYYHPEPRVQGIEDMKDGYMYFYGDHDSFFDGYFFGRLRPEDGKVDWLYQSYKNDHYRGLYVADHKIKKDFIYLVLTDKEKTYSDAFHIVKIDRHTGALVWGKTYNKTGGPAYQSSAANFGLQSVDVDDAGNIYVAGFQDNLWSVLKFDQNGNILYHYPVGNSTSQTGQGMFTFVVNNRVVHAGELVTGGSKQGYLIATDTSNSPHSLFEQPVIAQYQEPSNVKKILSYSSSRYAILNQIGSHATLEMRNTGNGKLIWSKDFSSNHYYQAGSMCLTKDNLIAVSILSHDTTFVSIDHPGVADSVFLFTIDAAGKTLFSSALNVKERLIHTPLDVVVTNDNSILSTFAETRISTNDQIDYQCAVLYRNGLTSTVQPSASCYFPQDGPQPTMRPYKKDSLIMFQNDFWSAGQTVLMYRVYGFTTYEERPIIDYNTTILLDSYDQYKYHLSIDSSTSLLFTSNNTSGINTLIRVNLASGKADWRKTENAGISLDKGSLNGQYIYMAGRQQQQLLIRKMNTADGAKVWDATLPAAGDNKQYVVTDQAFNRYRQQYVVCGYIADSSLNVVAKQPFYTVVDTTGKVLQRWIGTPDLEGRNQLHTIGITGAGQTLLGGSLYTMDKGRAAILIAADGIIPSADPETIAFCEGIDTTLECYVHGNTYQWQQDTGNGYTDLSDGTGVTGSHLAHLILKKVPATANGYVYRCLADGVPANIFQLEIQSRITPAILISGDTLLAVNKAGNYMATITFGGSRPIYRWEDSTSRRKAWASIPDANSDTLVYQPASLFNKLRCFLISDRSCVTSNTAVSNALPVNINILTGLDPNPRPAREYGVHMSPNPATDNIYLQELKITDKWETAEILTMQGTLLKTYNVRNRTSFPIGVSSLPAGNYLVVLRSGKGNATFLRFIKL